MGTPRGCDLLRRTRCHDLAAPRAALGAEIDHPVGRLYDVEIVFNDDDGIAMVAQPMKHSQELVDVVEVKPGRGLVQNLQSAPRIPLRQLAP